MHVPRSGHPGVLWNLLVLNVWAALWRRETGMVIFAIAGGGSMKKSGRESRLSCPLRGAGGTAAEQHIPASGEGGLPEFPHSWHDVPQAVQSLGRAAGAVKGFSGLSQWSAGFKWEHPRLLYWQRSGVQWRGLCWDGTAKKPQQNNFLGRTSYKNKPFLYFFLLREHW